MKKEESWQNQVIKIIKKEKENGNIIRDFALLSLLVPGFLLIYLLEPENIDHIIVCGLMFTFLIIFVNCLFIFFCQYNFKTMNLDNYVFFDIKSLIVHFIFPTIIIITLSLIEANNFCWNKNICYSKLQVFLGSYTLFLIGGIIILSIRFLTHLAKEGKILRI